MPSPFKQTVYTFFILKNSYCNPKSGSKSANSYAQYEKGRIKISLDQYEKLLQVANPYQQR